MKRRVKSSYANFCKKLFAVMTTFALVLTFTAPHVFAAVSTHRVLRAGYFSFDGYHNLDENGNYSGYGYDLLQYIARYENVTYEYVGYDKSWNDMLEMLDNGEIDFVSSATKTPERMEKYDFSEYNIGTRTTILTVKAGNTDIISGDYSTYDGITVGMTDKNSRNDSFKRFAKEHGFTYNEVIFDTSDEMEKALQKGSVDAIVSGSFRLLDNEWIVSSFDEDEAYIITRKGDSEIMRIINDALEKMDIYESGWRQELTQKYYKNTVSTEINLSPSESQYIKNLSESGEKLKVAVNPDRYPYSYVGDDGKITGIMADEFELIASRLGLDYELCQTATRQEYVDLLKTGTVDICLDMHEDLSNAEKYGYKITDIYVSAPFSWVLRKGFSGEPHIVATVGASTATTTKMDDKNVYEVKEYKYYDSFDDCLKALRNGDVDGYYTYTYNAERIVYENKKNDLKTRLTVGESYFCIGVRSYMDVSLLDALNKGVASLSSYEKDQITEKYTVLPEQPFSLERFANEYPYVVVFMAICIVLLIVCGVLLVLTRHFKKQADEALEKAVKADNAKTMFLSNMSHDIRTPINGIMGMLQIAKENVGNTEKTEDCLDKMQDSAKHLLSLINDVLDMSKIEADAVEIVNLPFDMSKLLEECKSVVEGQKLTNNINFTMNSNIKHNYVLGSELHIRRIIINILGNAIKYTPEGGSIVLDAKEDDYTDGKATFVISVSDTGKGIAPEFMDKLFEPFTQENGGSRSKYMGTGLGLAISKYLAERMGGTLAAKSTPGEGSTFTLMLTLPVTNEIINEPEATSGEEDLHGINVLLAEDNELNREIAVTMLEYRGCKVTSACDGEEAVRIFKENKGNFDVILMDVMMPNTDGLEATRQIRKYEGKTCETGVPIIAMTANVFSDDIKECLNAGMNSHVGKPVDIKILSDAVLKQINRKKSD